MTPPAASSYDRVPYTREAYTYTHPSALATLATVFALNPPPVERCRVLELGCAGGDNLIPMAVSLPQARFVGVDSSGVQVARGQQAIAALGLSNVQLKAANILDLGPDDGEFDYIIAHGVYSWVPAEVQQKILALCAGNLSQEGVAYISYNTYPGWCATGMARALMRFHVDQNSDEAARVQQARAFLGLLAGAVRKPSSAYAHTLREESARTNTRADAVLFHDQLEGHNEPLYFHEFIERASKHGLQYLQDAFFATPFLVRKPETQALLDSLSNDFLRQEQYHDFLTNCRFRRSLLCHTGATISRVPQASAIRSLAVIGLVKPQGEPAAAPGQLEEFRTSAGASISSNNPAVTATLRALAEAAPGCLWFEPLCQQVHGRLTAVANLEAVDPRRFASFLAEFVLQAWQAGLLELHVHVPTFATEPDERPVASPWARYESGEGQAHVTNLLHRRVALTPAERSVLERLDGSIDRKSLDRVLSEAAATGAIELGSSSQSSAALAQILHRLAAAALLLKEQAGQ